MQSIAFCNETTGRRTSWASKAQDDFMTYVPGINPRHTLKRSFSAVCRSGRLTKLTSGRSFTRRFRADVSCRTTKSVRPRRGRSSRRFFRNEAACLWSLLPPILVLATVLHLEILQFVEFALELALFARPDHKKRDYRENQQNREGKSIRDYDPGHRRDQRQR
jgi:hypothetical protein